MGAQCAKEQPRPGVTQPHDGGQGQEKDAYQTPVDLLVQPLFQWSDEQLEYIGNRCSNCSDWPKSDEPDRLRA